MKKKKTVPRDRGAAQSSPKPVAPSPAAAPSGKQASPATTTGFKSFILFVAAIISLLIFFGLEPNKLWLNQRIIPYWDDFKEQKLNLDLEERKLARYQTDYLFAKNVTGFFEKRGSAGKVLVLLPPTDYFKAHNLDIHVPEPAVFYYFTGLKTIWPNSAEASKANWFISVKNGGLVFDSVSNKQILLDTIAAFNKFKTSL
ncbi:hypothetical protein A3860_10235 [Niastella vici]|uniref:Uncharacterized protein n=1 Tax=Niastella vici TaxID=1703345 RepID=A0A1V9FF19_9BACT|nr:hypothetical protein [Niastella vici]OQP56945.1 hypothetical protein A3860_10235 [Niastella vici]